MKIEYIIFAIDDNPLYDGLWEINSEICRKLGLTPVLFKIGDDDGLGFYEDEYGLVMNVLARPNISKGLQAQLFRMYGTRYFPDEICMTSDIDMLIIDPNHFNNLISNIDDNDLVIYGSDAYDVTRKECIGIYGEDRYPICYNIGKGSTFNKILDTEQYFDDFLNKILEFNYPTHDTDELYFGYRVNNLPHGVNIHKIKRGYETPWMCPNRVDRPGKEGFNIYDKNKLKNKEYIDFHLSRPYSKYKKEINEVKDIIIKENKEVYLIGCHIENKEQNALLWELINFLEDNNKEFVISSHTLIDEEIIRRSVGYIYDTVNPKYKTWDLEYFPKYYYETETFTLFSPYISYGAADYYHVGAIRLLINGINYIKNLDYDIVHWIEYDSLPDLEMDTKSKILLKDYDFIFYGIGSRFSFLNKKVKDEFLTLTNDQIINLLRHSNYVAEKLIGDNLSDRKLTIFLDTNRKELWGRYSQNFNSIKLNWSLFEVNNDVFLFLANISNEPIEVTIELNNEFIIPNLSPHTWLTQKLFKIDEITHLKIYTKDKEYIRTNLTIPSEFNKLVKTVEYKEK